jgi:Ni/Fe-hydrogenase subunit HybB-like protein
MVGRHRPCRNVHFRFSSIAAAEMAYLDQSLCRGDDNIRRRNGRVDADSAPRTSMVFLLADALPRHHEFMAAVASPLVWDIFAIGTYIIVSILFWYMGLISRSRNAARPGRPAARAKLCMACRAWLAGRSAAVAPLRYGVSADGRPCNTTRNFSAQRVSLDFAIGNTPGWHSTIFPPYFVAGALFSGFAMALTISIPLRAIFGLKDFITARHLDNIAKIMLLCGLLVAYSYGVEISWPSIAPISSKNT